MLFIGKPIVNTRLSEEMMGDVATNNSLEDSCYLNAGLLFIDHAVQSFFLLYA